MSSAWMTDETPRSPSVHQSEHRSKVDINRTNQNNETKTQTQHSKQDSTIHFWSKVVVQTKEKTKRTKKQAQKAGIDKPKHKTNNNPNLFAKYIQNQISSVLQLFFI
jgi:hypothetical protein